MLYSVSAAAVSQHEIVRGSALNTIAAAVAQVSTLIEQLYGMSPEDVLHKAKACGKPIA